MFEYTIMEYHIVGSRHYSGLYTINNSRSGIQKVQSHTNCTRT